MSSGEDGEEEAVERSGGGGSWEFIEGDGGESGYGKGAGDLSSTDWDRGAGVCEYSGGEGVGPIYVAGEDQGEHPVDVVLYGSQYWEDYELWVCIEGTKRINISRLDKISIRTEMESRFWQEISKKGVGLECLFLKTGFFDRLAIYVPSLNIKGNCCNINLIRNR